MSLLVSISLDLRRLALKLGWLKNIPNHNWEKEEGRRSAQKNYKRRSAWEKRRRRGKGDQQHGHGMQSPTCACLCLYCSFASFFVNLQLFFSLSKPDSLFLSLLIRGFWFLRSWVQAISRLLIHGFMGLIFLVSGCWWFF